MEFLFRSIEILSACFTQKSSYNFTKENLAGKNWRELNFEKKWRKKLAEKMAGIKFGGYFWRENLAGKFGGKFWREKLTRTNKSF
jgi:hypothetical protein